MTVRDTSSVALVGAGDALRAARELLAGAGVAGPDAELLLAATCGWSRGEAQLAALTGRSISREQFADLMAAAELRAQRIPLQHILGTAPFRQLELRVGSGVFVPRPETELLVDVAISLAEGRSGVRILDVGTGSGAVAIALATELPGAAVVAVEASPSAFTWARRNIDSLAPQVELVHGEFESVEAAALGERFDILVSNPPYVPHAALPRDPEVLLHDPGLALFSGEDGLDIVRELARRGTQLVVEGGGIAIEHTEQQGAAVREVLEAAGWVAASTHRDLTGRDRVTSAILAEPRGD